MNKLHAARKALIYLVWDTAQIGRVARRDLTGAVGAAVLIVGSASVLAGLVVLEATVTDKPVVVAAVTIALGPISAILATTCAVSMVWPGLERRLRVVARRAGVFG